MLLLWKKIRCYVVFYRNIIIDLADIITNYLILNNKINEAKSPTIVFVTNKYIPRIDKLALAVKYSNCFTTIVISRGYVNYENSGIFKETHMVKSPFKTFWLIKRIKPAIVHVFSSWNFDQAYWLIRHKKKLSAKIVFDDYDVFAGMLQKDHIEKLFPFQFRKEKYCLENADAHCCRSLETQFAKRHLNYKINRHRIFFPEYMWNSANDTGTKKKNVVVYVGNFNIGILKLAEALQKIKWTLEIYSAFFLRDLKDSLPENVIVHEPLKPSELIEYLRFYPVAIQFPGCILDKRNSIYTFEKYKYAASGKIFDYLEAGLCVLISDELFQRWILKRYQRVIEVDELNPIDDIIRKLTIFEPSLPNNKYTYNHLTLRAQAPRLFNFYMSLISEN